MAWSGRAQAAGGQAVPSCIDKLLRSVNEANLMGQLNYRLLNQTRFIAFDEGFILIPLPSPPSPSLSLPLSSFTSHSQSYSLSTNPFPCLSSFAPRASISPFLFSSPTSLPLVLFFPLRLLTIFLSLPFTLPLLHPFLPFPSSPPFIVLPLSLPLSHHSPSPRTNRRKQIPFSVRFKVNVHP